MGHWMLDSLANFMSGLGVAGKDKLMAATFLAPMLQKDELVNAYRGDWITRKAIDIIPYDATREWRSWQADKDDITKIEELEKKLRLVSKTQSSLSKARLFGGCALILGVNDANAEEPLEPAKIKQGDLKFIHVISCTELNTGDIITDVESEWYGQPSYYERKITTTRGQTEGIKMHPSRVIPFIGNDRPDPVETNNVWGDSVLYSIMQAIKNAGTVSGSIATMIADARLDIIRVPDFAETVTTVEGQERLTKRFQFASTGKSIINALLLDKEEEWLRNQTSFASLPEVLQMYLMICAAAVDIPATRFLAQDPKGLNATGAGDTRNYYDRISSDQRLRLTPSMQLVDEVIVRSALGTYPEGIFYNWNPLWQLTETEKIDNAKKKSEIVKVDHDLGLIPVSALVAARQNQLIEDGTYPGLEDALRDAEAEGDEAPILEEPDNPPPVNPNQNPNDPNNNPNNPNDPNQPIPPNNKLRVVKGGRQPKQDARAADANARPLRIYREVINADAVKAWAVEQGLTIDDGMLRVVLVESKLPVDWMKMGTDDWNQDADGNITIPRGGPRVVDLCPDRALALVFASNRLKYRHQDLVRSGAAHEYYSEPQVVPNPYPEDKPQFEPRIILIKDASKLEIDAETLKPYTGAIVLGPEIFEDPVNADND
jgi:phage-related protein (TIGR01555 family)